MKKIGSIISKIFSTLAECILPNMPIMVGVGMLKVLLIILSPTVLGVLSFESDTYRMLSLIGDAGFYFMPIFTAMSSAQVFKTNVVLSGLVGAMLIAPGFVELVKNGLTISIYGLNVVMTDYGNQVIASIIAIWIMSYIYNLLLKVIPEKIKSILIPMLIILIMVPIVFCVIGPLGVFLGDKLVDLIMLLKNIGPLGNALMCAIIPFITIFGLGGANLSAMLLLSATGCDEILFFSNVMYNNILGFVTFALYLKDKKSETLAYAITSAIGGSSEPALFGLVMKDKLALSSLVIGGFVGGYLSGLFNVMSFAMASFGIFGIVTTIGPGSSFIGAIISLVVSSIVGFVICFITHKKS